MVYLWYMKWYRPERPEKPESFGYSTIMEPRRRSWFNWSRSIYAWNQRWSTKVGDIEVGCIPVSWSTESDSRVKLTNPRHVERNPPIKQTTSNNKKGSNDGSNFQPEKKSGSDLSHPPFDQATFRGLLAQHHQYIHHQWLKMLDADFIWLYTIYLWLSTAKGTCALAPSRPSAVARWAAHPSAASALRSVVYRRLNRAPAGKHLQSPRSGRPCSLGTRNDFIKHGGKIPHGVVMFQLAMFDGTRG